MKANLSLYGLLVMWQGVVGGAAAGGGGGHTWAALEHHATPTH